MNDFQNTKLYKEANFDYVSLPNQDLPIDFDINSISGDFSTFPRHLIEESVSKKTGIPKGTQIITPVEAVKPTSDIDQINKMFKDFSQTLKKNGSKSNSPHLQDEYKKLVKTLTIGMKDFLKASATDPSIVPDDTNASPISLAKAFVSEIENKINAVPTLIHSIASGELKEMTPEKFLQIQYFTTMLLSHVEVYTNILNKTLDGTKTLLNTQI